MSELEAEAQAICSVMDFPDVRDHFAIAAITGILAGHPTVNSRLAAEWSYEVADEMMKKRMENEDGTEKP
jgi:hypothetical protein